MQAIHTEETLYPSDAGVVPAFFAAPQTGGPYPALVIVHEVFGLNADIRNIATRFAQAGYAAVAPDLYAHGLRQLCFFSIVVQSFRSDAAGSAAQDLQGAIAFLRRRPQVDRARIGMVGFCMGGALTLLFASSGHGLRAASVFYGMPPSPIDMLSRSCPIVGSYGADDPAIRPEAVQRIEQTLATAGVPNDFKLYEDASHGFFNDGRRHREPQSQDAWRRTLDFFAQHL